MIPSVSIAKELSRSLRDLKFSAPVSVVYDPLDYAWLAHRQYLERWGRGKKETLLVGMNPGPWGMAQTGVPFGEVSAVRDWLGINAKIGKPDPEHPKRPIDGLDCGRSEVSGARLWGWARKRFRKPEAFFKRYLVLNYCPLSFMEASGRNLTPDKLPSNERDPLLGFCDRALRRTVEFYEPERVIGIGGFARRRAQEALKGLEIEIGTVLHPSPASPAANRGWAPQAERQLKAQGAL